MSDVQLATLRSACYAKCMPKESTLCCVLLDSLNIEQATYKIYTNRGVEGCGLLIDTMLQYGILKQGGENEKALRKHFGPETLYNNLLGVVIHIESLHKGDECFKLYKTGKDTRLIRLQRIQGKPPSEHKMTRLSVQTYEELLESRIATTYFPMVMTGRRIPGSPAEAAMAEADAQGGRECAVCCERKEQIIVSNCNHPICWDCGIQWRMQSKQQNKEDPATCPLCREPWDDFDRIYTQTAQQALSEMHFVANRCCWCNKSAHFRCGGCQSFEYCSIQCMDEHAVTHKDECISPWYIPMGERHPQGTCLKCVNGALEKVAR